MLQEGFEDWQPIIQQPKTTFIVKALQPSTSYQFRVLACNQYGAGQPSDPSDTVTTKGRGWLSSSPSNTRKKEGRQHTALLECTVSSPSITLVSMSAACIIPYSYKEMKLSVRFAMPPLEQFNVCGHNIIIILTPMRLRAPFLPQCIPLGVYLCCLQCPSQ